MDLDPDVPIPSTEDSLVESDYEQEDSVIITRSSQDLEDDVLGYYGEETPGHDEDGQEEVNTEEDDVEQSDATQRVEEIATVQKHHLQLDPFPSALGLDGLEDPFTTPIVVEEPVKEEVRPQDQTKITEQHILEPPKRPETPTRRMSKPEYDGTGWGEPEDEYADEPGSPGSVIHHPVSEEDRESPPAIPERIATIKAPGAKLKTRLSNTPSDLAAMREARRQVSHEVPEVPPIPEKHRNRLSRDLGGAEQSLEQGDFIARHPSFKNRSLTLDLDMGLSLDQDFERVIEAQKRG
jgi:hypothetical protein